MSNHYGAMVVGSACYDIFLDAGDLSHYFNHGRLKGKKELEISCDSADGIMEQVGGSALNTSLVLGPIAEALGQRVTVYKCMRLGCSEDNSGKDLILKALGNPTPNDKTLIDSMYDRNYAVPTNFVINNGSAHRDRMILKKPVKEFALNPEAFCEIQRALSHCRLLMANSSPHEENAYAMRTAHHQGLDIIYDYSENRSPEAIKAAASLLRYATYVVAPDDAQLPGMNGTNPQELYRRLVEEYHCQHVAVSNGDEAVLGYSQGRQFVVEIAHVNAKNVSGAGDTRDAALCAALAAGHEFPKAIEMASDIATFYVQQPTRRAFIEALPEHVQRSVLFKDHHRHEGNGHFRFPGLSWGSDSAVPVPVGV